MGHILLGFFIPHWGLSYAESPNSKTIYYFERFPSLASTTLLKGVSWKISNNHRDEKQVDAFDCCISLLYYDQCIWSRLTIFASYLICTFRSQSSPVAKLWECCGWGAAVLSLTVMYLSSLPTDRSFPPSMICSKVIKLFIICSERNERDACFKKW